MNKVITINLNGTAFQLEEAGYDTLRAYLDAAAGKLAGNPDREEILSDIEQAFAEKFRLRLSAHKNVVTTEQVHAAIAEMGPVDFADEAAETTAGGTGADATGSAAASEESAAAADAGAPRRLYRLYPEGAMISGVCNGIGAYFNIDPTFIRLAFIVAAVITFGGAALVYAALVVVVPTAKSDAERSAARGVSFTAQEFVRRAKAGYYEGMKSFPDEGARREWKRKFKRDMRAWGHSVQAEMQQGAQHWRHQWQRAWAERAAYEPGWGIALPFFSLFHAALALVCVLAVVSLLTGRGIFGVDLPASVPTWLGIILVLFAYGMVTLPLKAVRHMFYHQSRYGAPAGPRVFASFWDSVVWLAFVGVLVWLAYRHIPVVNDAFQALPEVFGDMIRAIKDWWHSH
ncbi:PspC domain-containing protein [Opitutus terrae]|uniref:Phage shock protein C, PspC n=1 Tax=Opitutus terrae (strain DSM 11246 / JCM 15787 / PB90-1) TaxID=452637 RepID=B1ZQP9_OPITP|nr:PspC domain-containing protein [Opitutus terrae]ACB77800.1 phage shock protein C, PspC [Opitutus terrae PB90-1]